VRELLVVSLLLLAGCDTGPAGGIVGPENREGTQVIVTDVVDGDTIDVRMPDGEERTIRLLGIDTPEVHVENDASDWEGVDSETCLRQYGHNASDWVGQEISGEAVYLVGDSIADNEGSYGRLLRYVVHENESINEQLIERGLARATDSYDGYEEQAFWLNIESNVRQNNTRAWGC
jgi:micrococcal nuclease